LNLLDTHNLPFYNESKNENIPNAIDLLSKSHIKTGALLPNDNLSIQQNERIMNHKKKDSNSHLNKFNNTVNYLESNANTKQVNTDYNSVKKSGNSPRNSNEGLKANMNTNNDDKANTNSNNYDFSVKAKRQYDNIIQTHSTPYSGINTDNSDNMVKSNINKQTNYGSHNIESSSGAQNKEFFSSAARFYDTKSNTYKQNNENLF